MNFPYPLLNIVATQLAILAHPTLLDHRWNNSLGKQCNFP